MEHVDKYHNVVYRVFAHHEDSSSLLCYTTKDKERLHNCIAVIITSFDVV